jgi:hypothetical protein
MSTAAHQNSSHFPPANLSSGQADVVTALGLSRTYRRTLEQRRRLRQSENEPTEPPKIELNGEKWQLNGDPE